MILNIPHSSTLIPPEYLHQYRIDIADELNIMTDWFVDELFGGILSGSELQPFAYSRLFCDVERLPHDEPMDSVGMGICYEKTHDGKQLRTLTPADKQEIVDKYYKPYHKEFSFRVRKITPWYDPIIVDCHSFSSETVSIIGSNEKLPDFCIGTDALHTPADLVNGISETIKLLGYTVGINIPYGGTIVPQEFLADSNVMSVMIEVNRKLYLDNNFQKNGDFNVIKDVVSNILQTIDNYEFKKA